jgi:serine/threonine protein kinase
MPTSLQQFVRNLSRSSLMSSAEVTAFLDGRSPESCPQEAELLAEELVAAKKLTRYQANAVLQGKTKGLVFDEYTVLEKLGEGGMGIVFKAQHRRMKRIVAIKMLTGARLKSPETIKRFYREVEAAARLSHPNIVAAYDAREQNGVHYLVLEYVDGRDLATLHTQQQEPLGIGQVVGYVLQTARGLRYAHKHGVIHRDIKPGNLLVDREEVVKILDMGLARLDETMDVGEGGGDCLTRQGQVMGTCDYMAPEQAEDAHRADHRSDIYSLGCTLYRLLACQPIYPGDSFIQVLLAHRTAPIPPLSSVRPDVPARLEAVFQKMVAKRPEDRQQSMDEVIADLEGCVASLSSERDSNDFRSVPCPAEKPRAAPAAFEATVDYGTVDYGAELTGDSGVPLEAAPSAGRSRLPLLALAVAAVGCLAAALAAALWLIG